MTDACSRSTCGWAPIVPRSACRSADTLDGVLAARPCAGRRDRDGLVLVAPPERGLAASVTAVPLPPGEREQGLADRTGHRLVAGRRLAWRRTAIPLGGYPRVAGSLHR